MCWLTEGFPPLAHVVGFVILVLPLGRIKMNRCVILKERSIAILPNHKKDARVGDGIIMTATTIHGVCFTVKGAFNSPPVALIRSFSKDCVVTLLSRDPHHVTRTIINRPAFAFALHYHNK